MLDLKILRETPDVLDQALARRGQPPQAQELRQIDEQRRTAQVALEQALARRNEASKQIGTIKSQGGDATEIMAEVGALKERVPQLEALEKSFAEQLKSRWDIIPNIPASDVPDGADEKANQQVAHWGQVTPSNSAQEHHQLGGRLGMDFAAGGKLSGTRFVWLEAGMARLERALANFMLDVHTQEFGYKEVSPPLMVRDDAMYGTGQLPKFADDLFKTNSGHWLIPTAEVSLTNFVAGEIVAEEILPLRFTALTPCFRAEAGAAGRDTVGMIRQHQFYKVELVSITAPDASEAEHLRMRKAAETILQKLNLPYRVMLLCTGDMGFAARKTFDLEVWLPGQRQFREISSCSNCGDFQARRMNARTRGKNEKATRFVHTLNGSGLAVGRTLVAILENYQQPDGSVIIPPPLRAYMNGAEVLQPKD